jgi:hypothetical protein
MVTQVLPCNEQNPRTLCFHNRNYTGITITWGDSFKKTVARGASFTHLVKKRQHSVGFRFVEQGTSGTGKSIDRELRVAELSVGRVILSAYRSGTNMTVTHMHNMHNLSNHGVFLCAQ